MPEWSLKGTVTLACNCDYGCPCNYNALPTYRHCEGGWNWHVEEGRFDGVRLDGLNFSLWGDWPAAIHEGNGEAALFVDERADGEQRRALEALLRGEAGGPWAILNNTIVRYHGPDTVSYDVELAEQRSVVRGGDKIALELEPIKNPVSGAEMHPRAVLPEGFIFKDGAVCASKVLRVDDGVSYDHSGQYAAVAAFEYSGP